jgi:polyhydroxyalkanoate synthase subunit PhaC
MTKQTGKDDAGTDSEQMSKLMTDLSERSQRVVQAFVERQKDSDGFQVADPVVIGKAFMEMSAKIMADPSKLVQAQSELWQSYAKLWENTAKRMQGETVEPVVQPDKGDRRFKDQSWSEEALFDMIKQSYLLTSNWMQSTVRDVDGLDAKTAEKVDFYTRQFVDAMSPTNFAATNPKVLQTAVDTKGENLVQGLDNLLNDLEKGKGELRISMTDQNAFTLGENIAASKGKVIYQNDLMQLLQFEPSTEKVFKRPLLIVPPWINKFYILDLQPKNSFIKWATDQGHTVFVISWVNPDKKHSGKRFDDYLLEGPLAAIDAIEKATGEKSINIIGYCIGGTLTASTLAYMAAKGDKRVKSATLFTTMVDFTDPGELGVFIDEEQLDNLDQHMSKQGYLDGSQMSQVFNMLRDNDLIWSFVVNNYLMGREPMAFDLLYWNSDSTRMPPMMHSAYLRKMYLENRLVEPGGMELDGVPIDMRKVKVPIYQVSTKDDHIAPWKSTYQATQLYKGPVRFVLSASGHIAGIINPPAANKYPHWTNSELPETPDQWFDGAEMHDGSWWTDWQKWVKKHGGAKVNKRIPGKGKLKALEDAPGSYVKMRIDG